MSTLIVQTKLVINILVVCLLIDIIKEKNINFLFKFYFSELISTVSQRKTCHIFYLKFSVATSLLLNRQNAKICLNPFNLY